MTPKKKARKTVKAKIRDIIRCGGATPVAMIVARINAVVAGWVYAASWEPILAITMTSERIGH
jgi:hypothetical protein